MDLRRVDEALREWTRAKTDSRKAVDEDKDYEAAAEDIHRFSGCLNYHVVRSDA